MSDNVRKAVALFAAWFVVLLAIAAMALLAGADMDDQERALLFTALQKRAPSVVLASLLLIAPLWFILDALFKRYIRAPRQLAEDARVMLSANPAHRAPLR